MSEKRRAEPSPPSKAYLVSFGDTMTALLAFFLVLNSFAKEQSGADLHAGTGSFIQAVDGLGLPGTYPGKTSKQVHQRDHINALYIVGSETDEPPDSQATGPDDVSNTLRVVDREQDDFDRFLIEMEHQYRVQTLAPAEGEVVFDLFEKLNPRPPLLPAAGRATALQVLPQLRDPRYQIELIVWAPTPSVTAWTRAVEQAGALRAEILGAVRMTPEQETRFRAIGQPWLYSKEKRPVMSFVVRKTTIEKTP